MWCLWCSFLHEDFDKTMPKKKLVPSASSFNAEGKGRTSSATDDRGTSVFFFVRLYNLYTKVSLHTFVLRPGCPFRVRSEAVVASSATWAPFQVGRPFAITSTRQTSCLWMLLKQKSVIHAFVVTRAPASRHMWAVARSKSA